MMRNKKAQSVIFDLFIALFVFILITSIISIMWNKYNFQIEDRVNQKEMWLKSYHITDLFVENQGSPGNWHKNFSNLEVLGLAYTDRKLSSEKIEGFLNFSLSENINVSWSDKTNGYNLTRELLNIEGFEFYFRLFNTFGVTIAESGRSPIFYGNLIYGTTTIRRYVSLEECERCIIEFSLWRWK